MAASADSAESLRDRLPGRDAERFGMGSAVVPSQDVAALAGPAGDGAAAGLAVRDRKMGNSQGKRRELELLIRSPDPGPVAVTLPRAAGTPYGTQEGSWSAVRVNSV